VARRFSSCLLVCVVGSLCLLQAPVAAFPGATMDRLDRFRELARTRLTAAAVTGGERDLTVYREVFALLDEEIVESLESGGVFASEGFLQERLDAFTEAWGGAALRVIKTGGVVVGAFRLADATDGNSVRVYGGYRGEPALLGTIHREGNPTLYPMPPAVGGAPQFLVVWEGARSGRGTTPVRVDLVRQEGDAVRTVWSTVELFDGELQTWSYAVHGAEITLRYELQYPGWVPGCDGQTEQADVYRYVPARQTFSLARRRLASAWHRDFHAVVDRFFTALRTDDGAALAELVPDVRLRARLSSSLAPAPECDAGEGAAPSTVSVAAMLSAERRPWALTFHRAGSAWHLIGAGPAIP